MDKTYTKLFHRILASSVWQEDDQTRLVWITLLASTDENGVVIGVVQKIASDARVSVEACQRALDKFLSPDPASLTPNNEGRRIERVDGGWRLLNHQKYREMMTQETKRQYFREKRREYRAKEREANRGLTAREIVRNRVNGGGV